MELNTIKKLKGKDLLSAGVSVICKVLGLVIAIETVHLVAHLLQEASFGELENSSAQILKILATVAARMLLIKIGEDAEHRLPHELHIVPAMIYALAAPVILLIALFEISKPVSVILFVLWILMVLVCSAVFRRKDRVAGSFAACVISLLPDLFLICGTAIGFSLGLSALAKGTGSVADAVIILFHAADYFRPTRACFEAEYGRYTVIPPEEPGHGLQSTADADGSVIIPGMVRAFRWLCVILGTVMGSCGIAVAASGSSPLLYIVIIISASLLYLPVRLIEELRTTSSGDPMKKLVSAALVVFLVMAPVIASVHIVLGVQAMLSYLIIACASRYFSLHLHGKNGTEAALSEGLVLLMDVLMLCTALYLFRNGSVSAGGAIIAVVSFAGSVGPFHAVGSDENDSETPGTTDREESADEF